MMRLAQALILFGIFMSMLPLSFGQTGRRVAVVAYGGPRADLENPLVQAITTKLVQGKKVQVVERNRVAPELLAQLDGARAGIMDPNSISRLGHVLGVTEIVAVRGDDGGWKAIPETVGSKTISYGNVWLTATVRIYSVETGAILASPESHCRLDHQKLSETNPGKPPLQISIYRRPAQKPTTVGDPQTEFEKMNTQVFATVIDELTMKITNELGHVARQPVAVLGVKDGLTYLNAGSASGLAISDVFTIIRLVDTGFPDPQTHKPVMEQKQVCTLTLSEVNIISKGSCRGSSPQAGDIAYPSTQ